MSEMTDRELLEAAAKAVGWSCWQSKHGYLNVTDPDGGSHSCCHGWTSFDSRNGERLPEPTLADALDEISWNPLADDGDAFRLAVKLNLMTEVMNDRTVVWVAESAPRWSDVDDTQMHGTDPYAATRRAIVRAAASMAQGADRMAP